jgi:outer membrane receptor protein involved in Fe transport
VSNVLKTGYAGWRKDRLFWVVNTDSRGFSGSDYQPMNEAFDPAFNPGGTIVIDPFSDQYHNTASLHAGYVMLDSKIGRKLRVSGGVRGEYYDLTHISTVQERLVENIMLQNPNSNLDYSDLLDHEAKFNLFPSAGLTYGLTPKMNLRFSYSKSIIRPDMRELAFFREYDFELGGTYQGNAPMLATRLQNYDLRYEWFPSPDEILSFSLFYKKIIHPMEIYDVGNRIYELRNDLVAKNKGIEVEIRKSFAFTHLPVLRNLSLYANFTRLFSKVTPMTVGYGNIDPSRPGKLFVIYKPQAEVERPQAGASNYTYNAGAYYDTKWVSVSLSYNYITNRVFRASETYQESLFETPLPSMDGQVCVNLLKNKARFKCNVSNILGKVNRVYSKREGSGSTTLLYERGDFINFEANPGRTYGIAFDYHF